MPFLSGCAKKDTESAAGKPRIAVSILPQAGLAREIANGHVDILVLAGEGQSPHSYHPTARQMAALAEADILLTIGVPFEQTLLKQIQKLYPDLRIVDTRRNIPMREMQQHHQHDHAHCAGSHNDPHVWLCPQNAKIIAKNICAALISIDPPNASTYRANLMELLVKLDQVDAELREALKPCKGHAFYVFHPSFGYFGDAYGMVQKAVEIEGKDPSPRQLAQLIDQARAEHVRIIFVQKQFSNKSAAAVAEALDGSVIALDPLAENYISNLRDIALKVKQSAVYE